MIDRVACGQVPHKHHIALRRQGRLMYEACLTRQGFDGAYTILYHEHRPQALEAHGAVQLEAHAAVAPVSHRAAAPLNYAAPPNQLRRHYRSAALADGNTPSSSRNVLLQNADVSIGCLKPRASDTAYTIDSSADELLFVLRGKGTLRSTLGDLAFEAGDYIGIPRGLLHRFELDTAQPQHWLALEFHGVLGVPKHFRNPVGQLRMDAPYSHRDFRRPEFVGPVDEGIREVLVRRGGSVQSFRYAHSPLDVVGWDGCVYPWAFPIERFQPRVGAVHLPPIWHATFDAPGVLVCSFVPRPLDFHPEAVPCPYTHTSDEMDEVLFYARGDFASRRGVEQGSLTLHPAGMPHGPHPGRYEASIGNRHTDELAVMLDCTLPLQPTRAAEAIEDAEYEASFAERA
jgi:homogentisate 1,2-dioxygenase